MMYYATLPVIIVTTEMIPLIAISAIPVGIAIHILIYLLSHALAIVDTMKLD